MSKDIQTKPQNSTSTPDGDAVLPQRDELARAPDLTGTQHDLRPVEPDGKPVLSLLLAITLAIVVYFAVQTFFPLFFYFWGL